MSLEWAALADAATRRFGRPPHRKGCPCNTGQRHACWTPRDLADVLGIPTSTVEGWRNRGTLPTERGDAVAVALGRLPDDLWPAWADWIDAQAETARAADEALSEIAEVAAASADLRIRANKAARDRRHQQAHRDRRNARRRERYQANRDVELARQVGGR